MRSIYISQNHAPRWLWRLLFWTFLALMLLLLTYRVAAAQCIPNPTNETAVGLRNASSYYLTFYIDGVKMDGVPPGDRSVDFNVTSGQHVLLAEAVIDGEIVSVSRAVQVPIGYVCTWTVTDPQRTSAMEYKERPRQSQYGKLNGASAAGKQVPSG